MKIFPEVTTIYADKAERGQLVYINVEGQVSLAFVTECNDYKGLHFIKLGQAAPTVMDLDLGYAGQLLLIRSEFRFNYTDVQLFDMSSRQFDQFIGCIVFKNNESYLFCDHIAQNAVPKMYCITSNEPQTLGLNNGTLYCARGWSIEVHDPEKGWHPLFKSSTS